MRTGQVSVVQLTPQAEQARTRKSNPRRALCHTCFPPPTPPRPSPNGGGASEGGACVLLGDGGSRAGHDAARESLIAAWCDDSVFDHRGLTLTTRQGDSGASRAYASAHPRRCAVQVRQPRTSGSNRRVRKSPHVWRGSFLDELERGQQRVSCWVGCCRCFRLCDQRQTNGFPHCSRSCLQRLGFASQLRQFSVCSHKSSSNFLPAFCCFSIRFQISNHYNVRMQKSPYLFLAGTGHLGDVSPGWSVDCHVNTPFLVNQQVPSHKPRSCDCRTQYVVPFKGTVAELRQRDDTCNRFALKTRRIARKNIRQRMRNTSEIRACSRRVCSHQHRCRPCADETQFRTPPNIESPCKLR